MLGPVGSSLGAGSCGFAIDAGDFDSAKEAGDELLEQVLDADPAGCTGFRIDLAGTFHLDDTLLWDFPEPLTLSGPAAGAGDPARLVAVTSGAPESDVTHRILTAEPAPPGDTVGKVTIERLILTGGAVQSVDGDDDLGGAVLADVVELVDSELVGNSAVSGGAVAAREVRAERTSFVDNGAVTGAGQGGAIRATEQVTLVNVTFSGNVAGEGGAVWLPATGTLDATSVTFSGNEVSTTFAGTDLHLGLTGSGSVTLRGVLFAGVDDESDGPSCGGVALSATGMTLEVDGSFEAVDDPADLSCDGVTPTIGPLALTTVPFLAGTTALPVPDGGPASIGQVACGAGWPAVDQRGVARPQGDTCDAGAVEREVMVVPPPPPPPLPPVPEPQPEPEPEAVVEGPVPTSVPAGDGTCADGCPAFGRR